jgi:signal transduction histidine kinase
MKSHQKPAENPGGWHLRGWLQGRLEKGARHPPKGAKGTKGAWHLPGWPLTLLLLAAVVTIDGAAVWGILTARQSTRRALEAELSLQTAVHARSLEAVLATLRGDLIFLSQSPPLVRYPEAAADDDPLVRRWSRLDVEGGLLLFLQAHPAVRRIVLRGAHGEELAAAGRRGGAPVLLPVPAPPWPAGEAAGLWPGRFALGPAEAEAGDLEVWVDPRQLLAIVAPGLTDRLSLIRAAETGEDQEIGEDNVQEEVAEGAGPATLRRRARAWVREEEWEPPLTALLVRTEGQNPVLSTLESLTGHYRTTVVLHSLVILTTLLLGWLALRQARRAAALEAARRHEGQVRELERQLFHSERLASVGRLAAGLAHEINNPLEGMSNYLSLLEEDLRDGRGAAARQMLGRLRTGLERVAGTVRQVLAFADPGRAPKERLDLGPVLAEAVDLLRSTPAFRAVEVRFEPPPEPLVVPGNRVTLGQLFLNLLLNACQAQPDGGEVELAARREGDRVRVTVADRGPGLPEEVEGRIFEPFVSTRGSTGLGLAVCHGIVADHGGSVRAGDRPGGGAVFEVELPAAEPTVDPAAEPAAAPQPAAGVAVGGRAG